MKTNTVALIALSLAVVAGGVYAYKTFAADGSSSTNEAPAKPPELKDPSFPTKDITVISGAEWGNDYATIDVPRTDSALIYAGNTNPQNSLKAWSDPFTA
jgi:hypothetical protein